MFPPPPITLTKQDIQNNFDSTTFSKGKSLYLAQQVRSCDLYTEPDKTFIVSTVQGGYLYEQEIELSEHPALFIHASCSCPVGYKCKHTVAALLHYIDMHKITPPKDTKSSEKWLQTFLEIYTPKKDLSTPSNSDFFIIFRLLRGTRGDEFEVCKAKRLKNGTVSKGTPLSLENLFYYSNLRYHYDYITEEDEKLIKQLSYTTEDRYNTTYKFKGEFGALLLKQLVQSERCYYKNNTTALTLYPTAKKLTFEWIETRGEHTLVSNLYDTEELFFNTIPPMCIDFETHRLYEVETAYQTEGLHCMLNAPAIPTETLTHMTQKILEQNLDVTFPIPQQLKEEVAIPPTPYLYLYTHQNGSNKIHIMELHFMYGDYEVNCYPFKQSEPLIKEQKIINIIRDERAEKQFQEEITSLGFLFDTTRNGYISTTVPHKQAAIERWRVFTETHLLVLQQSGWKIEIDESFHFNFEYADAITIQSHEEGEMNPWFELSFSVEVQGKQVQLMPIISSLLEEYDVISEIPERINLELEEGKFLHLESKNIKPILKTIFELFDKKEGDALVIKPYDAHLLAIDEKSEIVWKGAKELKELALKLKNFQGIASIQPAKTLDATLRTYQQFGLDWLNFLYTFKFGGILADDMGLGKTIQTLAFLQYLKSHTMLNGPTLIIMPTSLIGNWKSEIKKFTPELRYLELYGIQREEKFKEIQNHDIILTTYQLAQRDVQQYQKEKFLYIILDEAQKIKNPKTKMAQAIKSFSSTYKLALSGTPIENHLGELWSIFDFLMPGFLGDLSSFKTLYQTPIEKEHDMTKASLLNKKVKPFILRRTKEEVALELPAKTEIIKRATFGNKQATLYENIRISMEKKVREAIQGKGLSRSHITILDALLKLRQVCCDPSLLKLESSKNIKESTKLAMFLELIEELHTEKRKVLVFSQFTAMLTLLEKEIKALKIPYTKLTGSTRKREEAIEKFTQGEAQIFLISLKAGGVGLNLVEADTVIHYDPWWNPAVENQATDRAYRIGQDKPVFVYKLIVENSIEEQILKLQEKKRSLQEGIYEESENKEERFHTEALVELLKL